MIPWTAAAVRNNAEWCDIVCRTHGMTTTFDAVAWTSATRTPLYYPDAITLAAEVSAVDLLVRIDSSMGCSIKDSYATIDLGRFGFRVLFDAEWIVSDRRTFHRAGGQRWERVRGRDDLVAWEAAWQGDGDQRGLFKPELLDNDQVTFLVSYAHGRVVAGAILNLAAGVVGISNFFAAADANSWAWEGCVAFARELCPGVQLVGYESGARLHKVLDSGFAPAGPLRVWAHDG
jgi:hypothetical protein